MTKCRICGSGVHEFGNFGDQPLSNRFLEPGRIDGEYFFRLAVGTCEGCSMVQLMEEVPRHLMFNGNYPYLSSGSAVMQTHFRRTARYFLDSELSGPDPFFVEIGCNDGILLRLIAEAGIRHLGVEPSEGVAGIAQRHGTNITTDFFQESTAAQMVAQNGLAQVIYAANTICHIPYLDSVFRGVDVLLSPDGIFVFEDPYLGDIVEKNSYDQIYDEHFYFFSATSVSEMARNFGFELVDVERLPVHGGEVRYTIARADRRRPTQAVAELLAEEKARELLRFDTLKQFMTRVERSRDDLVNLLKRLKGEGSTVVGYGATAKSATVANYCGIGPDLVPMIADSTPGKQGRLTPGAHIPVRPSTEFAEPYPDYALLFAWNHAEEITKKEIGFRDSGGKWILYVPHVHVI